MRSMPHIRQSIQYANLVHNGFLHYDGEQQLHDSIGIRINSTGVAWLLHQATVDGEQHDPKWGLYFKKRGKDA